MVEVSTFGEGDTPEDSVSYMKTLIIVTMCRILKKRKVIGEEYFVRKTIAGLHVDALDEDVEFGQNALSRINGACRALRKGYLSKFILLVSKNRDDPQNAVEAFTWHFDYADDDLDVIFADTTERKTISFRYTCPENLKNDIKLLINFIDTTITCQMEELPPGCFAGLRLAYNDAKPANWQAPGFVKTEIRYNIQGPNRRTTSQYAVKTGQHQLFMEVESALFKENVVVGLLTPTSSPISSSDDLTRETFIEDSRAESQEKFEIPRVLNFSDEMLDNGCSSKLLPTSTADTDEGETTLESSLEAGMDSRSFYNFRTVSSSEDSNISSMSAQPPRAPRKRISHDCDISPIIKKHF